MLWHKLIGAGGAAPSGPTLTYLGSDFIDDGDNVSWTTSNFSVSESGLFIACCVSLNGSARSWTDTTIGGVSGTLVEDTAGTFGNERTQAEIRTRVVTSGSYAVTISGQVTGRSVGVAAYLLTGYTSATATATGTDGGSAGVTSRAVTFTVPANGVALYVGGSINNSSGYTLSSPVTDTKSLDDGGGSYSYGGIAGQIETATELTSQSVTMTTASEEACLVGAAWS